MLSIDVATSYGTYLEHWRPQLGPSGSIELSKTSTYHFVAPTTSHPYRSTNGIDKISKKIPKMFLYKHFTAMNRPKEITHNNNTITMCVRTSANSPLRN